MRRNEARGTTSIVIAMTFLISGCASGPRLHHRHEYTLAPGQAHQPGLKTALLIPLDSTNEERVGGLDVANDRIEALIVQHLASKGIEVVKADPPRFEQVLEDAYDAERRQRLSGQASMVSSKIGFADVVPKVLEGLDAKAELVVSANVVMRRADYQGTRTIAWDGVRRRETVYDVRMSGSDLPVASVAVAVFSPDGKPVYSGFGGLEPVFRIDRNSVKYVVREHLFEDERNLHEGICIAFYPYFGMDEFCHR
jgi:hypothetical protein